MMVLSRTDSKRRRKDDNDVLQESPKRTKVHAQRKFAQGSSSLTSPALTPVKDKVKVNGITPPSDVLPVKRPNTEDFLTFLCFRGTKILPARLDFFSNASVPEQQAEGGVGGSTNTAGSSKSNTRLQEKNNPDKSPCSSSNVKPRSQPTSAQGRAVKALKKKYHEQRLAKQKKTTLTKLVQKVTKHQTRYGTRSSTVQLGVNKKQNRPGQRSALLPYAKAKKVMPAKPIKPNLTKVSKHKHKHLRLGLRSGGQLPPGSDVGIKSPVRRPRVHAVQSVSASNTVTTVVMESAPAPVKAVNMTNSTSNKNSKSGVKPIASSLSDFSSDDDQPLVKKSRKSPPLKAKAGTKSLLIRGKQTSAMNSNSSSTGRPSRKTKEAATLYMEMLGKDLRSPDEYDDDTLSVESFPELPNKKKIELREKELKALAEKNLQDKEDKPVKVEKLKPIHHTLKKNVGDNEVANVQSIDDRSKRILLRNKAKTRMFRDKDKTKKILKRSKKTAAASNRGRIVGTKNKKMSTLKTSKEKNVIVKKRRGLGSKRLSVETTKVSLSSSSSVKSPSVPCIVTEQELKTKQPHFEDNYSESDEEPLKVLSAKLPKKKKNVQEGEIPVGRKDIKDLVSKSSASPERSAVLNFEKEKSSKKPDNSEKEKSSKKPDIKEVKKVISEDKKGDIRSKKEKTEGIKGKEIDSKKQVKDDKGKSVKFIDKKEDIRGKEGKSEEIKVKEMNSKKQVKDDKAKTVVSKKEEIRGKEEKSEEIKGKEIDSKKQVKGDKGKLVSSITKKEDIKGQEERSEEIKGKEKDIKKQVKDDKPKSVPIKKEDIRDKEDKSEEQKGKEIDSKKQVKDNQGKADHGKIDTENDKILNKRTIQTNKVEEKNNLPKTGCKEEKLKNSKKIMNKLVKENVVSAVKSNKVPVREETLDISKNKSKNHNEVITEKKVEIQNESIKEFEVNEVTLEKVAEIKNKCSVDILPEIKSTVADKNNVGLLENMVSSKPPPFSDKKSTSLSDKKPIPTSFKKPDPVSEAKPSSFCDTKPTATSIVSTPNITEEKYAKEIIKKTEDVVEIKKPVVGSSKIPLNPSSSKNKPETSKTLQTCDSSDKNNVNKIEKSEDKPLCIDNSKSVNSDNIQLLATNISQPVKSEDTLLTNNRVVEKLVKSEDLKSLPVSNKVIKPANPKSLPSSILFNSSNTFEEPSKISGKNKNENVKCEDKLKSSCFSIDGKSSDNGSSKTKLEDNIPLPPAAIGVVTTISEDVNKLSASKSSTLKNIDGANGSSCNLLDNNSNAHKIDKFDGKEILPGNSLTKTGDLKIINNEPKKANQDLSKLIEKQVSKSSSDLCDNLITDQSKLSKNIEPKITSTKMDCKNLSVKKIETKVGSFNNEKVVPSLRPDEDLRKPPTCFTGLLKQQDSKSFESETCSKSKFVSVDDGNIVKEGNYTKASNSSIKCEEKLAIKPGSDEIIKSKEDKKHPTLGKSNKTGKEPESSVSSKASATILDKTPVKEKTELMVNSCSPKTKTIIDIKSNTGVISSPGKKSVNDIWFSAFKNAKIPKPGQSSPKRNEQVPFVRKPFTGSSLKKQINFSSGSASEHTSVKKDLHEDLLKVNQNYPATANLPNLLSTKKGPFLSSVTTTIGSRASTTVTTVVPNEIKSATETSKNVIDPETLRQKEAEVEDIVRRYVGCELEKMHAGLRNVMPLSPSKEVKPVENVEVFQSKTEETTVDQRMQSFVAKVIDKQHPLIIGSDISSSNIVLIEPATPLVQLPSKISENSLSPLQNKLPAEKNVSVVTVSSILPLRNDPSSVVSSAVNPPVEASVVGGKHHHLLPVEQTLKKLSQSKGSVSRKPNVSSPNMKQQLLQQQDNQLIVPSTSAINLPSKEKESVVSQKPFYSDIEDLNDGSKKLHGNLISKRKVNMSTEDINKWLNDSTSACIEHTKNCGIFEKNQCECKPTFSEVVNEPIEQEIICKSLPGEEESTATNVTPNLTVENVDKKETNATDNVVADKTFVKTKEVNTGIAVKNVSEKKVNVALPIQNKLPTILPAKPDIVTVTSRSIINVSEPNKPDEKQLFHKAVMPSCDNSFPSNLSKLKVSRGTNKMGDSEAENSSRDPSEVSSPPPREDVSSADESPDKFVQPERRSIFQQRRSAFRSKLPISRSPSAFSPENESSVYAFEPDLPMTSTPFRRNKSKEGRVVSTPEDDGGLSSTSIAVQVNLDNEAVLECSTQTETDYDESEGHLFYIPLQQNSGEVPGGSQQVFQGVAVKLGTEGPDQRVIMRAKLVTKPPSTFASSSSRPLVSSRDIKGSASRPEQKVKPLSVSSNTPRPPVGTVQPTTRIPNPPDISPPPVFPAVPMKRIPTPERIKRISQSPEVPKKDDSNPALFLSSDNVKKDLPVTVDSKSSKEVPVATPNATVATTVDKTDLSLSADQTQKLPPSPSPSSDRSVKSSTPDLLTKESIVQPSTSKSKSPSLATPSRGRKPRQQSKNSRNVLDSMLGGLKTNQKSKNKNTTGSDGKGAFGIDGNIKLKDAPSFSPTEREFQDPLEYIEKIRPLAEKYGLCRIIPPSNFKPECKVSDDMRFTAYNQYVHKMLHRWGPNVKEMLAIKKYLATQSIALTHPPWIGGMEVDLPKLYQTVQNCGGLKEVIEKKRWQRVADAMRIPKSAQDRVTKLDDIYCKYLLPYDTLSHEERTKLFEEVEKEWEKRVSSTNSSETDSSDSTDNGDLDECIVKGRNMALSGFYRIARNTMAVYFRAEQPSAHDVEAEFWNHVGTRQSHVCVHSGSIDSGSNGYGFPTAKNSSTARHPWNLKVLTNNSGSILRSLGPIMGVTVPTLHVGMVFTACCWYRDPHGLPWIEYLHTGASKIWYGIPDESSNAFREVVMELVPNLCRDKTICLASDTAMIPPNLLVKRGISICRTVQEPGQFILVFPKAFTSSICTGYLVSESVYFALPSWLSTAQQVFKDISDSSEPSMFSLERLLFSIASDARSHVDVLLQVLPMVQCIRENEIIQRNQLEKLGLVTSERLPLNKRRKSRVAHEDDSDYECETCRANLFLSLVTNTQEQAVYCLSHAIQLLKSKPNHLQYCRLLYTYDMDELDELIEKIKSRIETKSQKKSQNKLSLPATTITSSATSSTAVSSSSSQTPGSSLTKS